MTRPDPDPRLNAWRLDLADSRLAGRVQAAAFVEGAPGRIRAPLAPLRRRPAADAPLDTEALCGETCRVFERDGEGWAWIQLDADGYVGYAPEAAIDRSIGEPVTHRVSVPRTLVFAGPDIKTPPLFDLPMGACVAVSGEARDHNTAYGLLAPAGAIVAQHLAPVDGVERDYVAVAERFLEAPYLWGGKSVLGIDCSGLVQIACAMAGLAAPRDTDMQEAALGTRVAGVEALERGDLIFWRGHVGIMVDGTRLLHANAHHMRVAVEPLQETIERFEDKGVAMTAVRRMRGWRG